MVQYRDGHPMCSNLGDRRVIYLYTKGNHWGQWVYQFAHEYCHHLINGEMSGAFRGLLWFEEVLCELASRFVIEQLSDESICVQWGLQRAYPVLQYYHDTCLGVDENLAQEFDRNGSLVPWLPLLSVPPYQRDHYSVIARKMLPVFLESPYLWRIIGLVGDLRYHESLEELFLHLESRIEKDQAPYLLKIRALLLGR